MKQAGRPTARPQGGYTYLDFFAEEVRRVLKKCTAPTEWGDEEALFLLRLVLDEDFMDDAECALSPNVRLNRAMDFASLNRQSKGRLFHILHQLDNAVTKRTSRKGFTTAVWQLVASHAIRVRELAECKADNPNVRTLIPLLREEIDLFWDSKAQSVADYYGESLSDVFTAKDVERAREAIREMNRFKKRVPTPEELAEWESKRRMRQLRMQRMNPTK